MLPATLPWETLGAMIVSFVVGVAVAIVSPGLRSAWKTYAGRLHRFLVLLACPVAHKRPHLKLNRSSIVCTRHVETDGTVVGYSLRLRCSVNNNGNGVVLIWREGVIAALSSYDDRRRNINFVAHPFKFSLLGPGDTGAEMQPIALGPGEKRLLDIGLVTYMPSLDELPGKRLEGYLIMRLELTPRPGRNAVRYGEALEPQLRFRFALRSSGIIEEIDNWLETQVALAREVGATEDDISNRLLPRGADEEYRFGGAKS